MIKKLLLTSTILAASFSSHAFAESSATERLNQLEQEINILKRQQEVKDEEAEAARVKTPLVEFGKKGLKITSPDKTASLSIRGYAQADYRAFIDDGDHSDVDSFIIRRARPIIESQVGDAYFRLMPDFGGSSPSLYDAFVEYRAYPAISLRVGKYKPPVGLDRLKSATDTTFVERSLPTNLGPNRDIGVSLFGTPIPQISYELGVFNGAADLGNENSDGDDKKDIAARVFLQPFNQGDSILQGLGFGIAGTIGDHEGSTSSRQLGDYRTPGQARFFSPRSSSFADGQLWRFAPQGYYYYGPFGVLAEYTLSSQEISNGNATEALENKAGEIQLSYVLTGERASYKGVTPDSPFDPKSGQWGAWEIATKYGELSVDKQAFPLFADPNTSAQKAKNWGAALNGYLTDTVKVSLDYENTAFEGGASRGADRETEQVILSRITYKF